MKPISKIARSIEPSATLAIDALAKQMKNEGIDVIGFGAGEPDFNTPEYIKEAGIRAIIDNRTRYTKANGVLPLREAICASLKKEFDLDYNPSQISVSSGAKNCIYTALQCIINMHEEVILPAPYWVTYDEAIKMAGGVPVIIDTDESTGFRINADMLRAHITDKTKCLILTNPSNPTGMVYSKQELQELAEVIVENDLYVISDEIYCSLNYKFEHTSMASLGEEIKERTILINGVSKSFAMTGWRIGYCAANEEISKVMSNYLSHSTGNACTIAQYASIAALEQEKYEKVSMKAAFDERRKFFVERVNEIPGVSCIEPDGAFYVFMNIKEQLGKTFYGKKVETSEDFASCLLKNALVAVVPGIAFGVEGYLRWSYATSLHNIVQGLDRFEQFLKEGK